MNLEQNDVLIDADTSGFVFFHSADYVTWSKHLKQTGLIKPRSGPSTFSCRSRFTKSAFVQIAQRK